MIRPFILTTALFWTIVFDSAVMQGQVDSSSKNLAHDHQFYMDLRVGFRENFTDTKTSPYFDNYWNIPIGLGFYYRNFTFAYTFTGASIGTIKKNIPLNNTDSIRQYDHKKDYWLNLLMHNFSLGYEIKIARECSVTPSTGFIIVKMSTINQGAPHGITSLSGFNCGLSITKYFPVSPEAQAFISMNGNFNKYDLSDKIPALGDSFVSFSLSFGFKFHPISKEVAGMLNSTLKGKPFR